MELLIDKIKMYPMWEKGVKLYHTGLDNIISMYGVSIGSISVRNPLIIAKYKDQYLNTYIYESKPILRPLSDLNKSIKQSNGVKVCLTNEIEIFEDVQNGSYKPYYLKWYWFKILLDNYFDVFGLIELGEAVAYDPVKHNNCYE